MAGQRVGYIRVSTDEQNRERQLDGVSLDKVFSEAKSGKNTDRPQLQAMLQYVREGDTVTVHSIDRLARNLDDLRKLVFDLTGRGVRVEFLKENLVFDTTDSPWKTMFLTMTGMFAEFERAINRERQREGIELAKKRGAYKGRKRVLTKPQVLTIRQRLANGESVTALAQELRVSRMTIYNYLNA
nr:recombinase family protein [Bacilli bacterium]